ncbi:MAG: hypothetical protein GEV05_25980 [Betaproteobacteria bacterium]|nr:hypothetical protein [Betaproteobacteria bacterium]
MLCAALAACEHATIRMIADVLGVTLERLDVEVTGTVDVRGCLAIDRQLRVGFPSLECRVDLAVAPGTSAAVREVENRCRSTTPRPPQCGTQAVPHERLRTEFGVTMPRDYLVTLGVRR